MTFRRDFRIFLGLLAASVVASAGSFGGPLLGYDDQNLLLGPEGALGRGPLSFFTDLYYYAWLPFYGLSYWIDGRIAGGSPLFLHLMNALWHAAAGYAAFRVLRNLVGPPSAALLGALLFVVHPLHAESVSWIAGRKELVSGFFFFLAWGSWQAEPPRWGRTALWFLVACFSKASAVALPAFLFAEACLHPRWEGARGRGILRAVPVGALAVVPVLVHLLVGSEAGVVKESTGLGARAFAGLSAWGEGLFRILVPTGLSIDYPEAHRGNLPAALLLAAAVVAALLLRRRAPRFALSVAFFFAGLLPFNNVFPATDVARADRYFYLPLFGAALALSACVFSRRFLDLAAGGAIVLCAFLSFFSSRRFVSDEALWTATLETRPESALASVNRGLDRVSRAVRATPRDPRLLDAGIADLERAVVTARLREHRAKAQAGLVLPLLLRGRLDEAVARGEDALQTVEGSDAPGAEGFRAGVLYDRGLAWLERGRPAFAARDFAESARLLPRPHVFLEAGKALFRMGRPDEARAPLERAAAMAPASPDAHLWLAQCARAAQDRAAQERHLEEASRRAPADEAVVEGWVEFWLDALSPDYPKAAAALRALPEGSPARRRMEAGVEAERALFLFRRGDREGAVAAADEAVRKGVEDPVRLYELGNLFTESGRYDDAVRCFEGAGDFLSRRRFGQDAIARARALKAYALLSAGDRPRAAAAFRAALDARPRTIEAGGAPLLGEIEGLRAAREEGLLCLAAAVVAGDVGRGEREALALLEGSIPEQERRLALALRGLLRLYASRDFRGAESDFRAILSEAPEDRWARLRLGQARLTFGVGWLETARRSGSEARRVEASAAIREADGIFSALLREDAAFDDARLARGEARLALDEIDLAKEDFREVRARGEGRKEVYPKEATVHRLVYVRGGERGNLDHAIGILEEAIALDPNHFDALFELGNVYHVLYDRGDDPGEERQRSFNRAVLYYRRAMSLNPRNAAPRREWAGLCLKVVRAGADSGKFREADELLRRVEAEAGDFPEVRKERARLALRPEAVEASGRPVDEVFDEAKRALEEAERTAAPADPELPALRSLYHRRRGYVYYWTWVKLKEGALRERARALAVEEWKAALRALPDDPENLSVRDRLREIAPGEIDLDRKEAERAFAEGAAAFRDGKFEEAARCFERASALFPELTPARLNLGLSLARLGRTDDAARQLEGVANGAEGSAYPEAMFELGSLYYRRGERATAKLWYRRHVAAMEALGRGAEESVRRAKELIEEIR